MFKHYFARQAAAVLLKMAKTTSDPQFAAALVERAADIKDRVQELPPPPDTVMAGEHSDEAQTVPASRPA